MREDEETKMTQGRRRETKGDRKRYRSNRRRKETGRTSRQEEERRRRRLKMVPVLGSSVLSLLNSKSSAGFGLKRKKRDDI